MAAPTLQAFAAELYRRLQPVAYADESYDYHLAKYCEGVGLNFELIEELARDSATHPGWAKIMDPAVAPEEYLAWLAQITGLAAPTHEIGESDEDYYTRFRALIAATPNFKRGTPSAIVTAAQQTLTGNKQVVLYERDTSPYHLTVVTRTSETPDPALTNASLQAAKPAGLILVHVVVAGLTYDELDTMAFTYDQLDAMGWTDYDDMEDGIPGGGGGGGAEEEFGDGDFGDGTLGG